MPSDSGCPAARGHDLQRNYSLSGAPKKDHLRISVKKDGVVSTYLHDGEPQNAADTFDWESVFFILISKGVFYGPNRSKKNDAVVFTIFLYYVFAILQKISFLYNE